MNFARSVKGVLVSTLTAAMCLVVAAAFQTAEYDFNCDHECKNTKDGPGCWAEDTCQQRTNCGGACPKGATCYATMKRLAWDHCVAKKAKKCKTCYEKESGQAKCPPCVCMDCLVIKYYDDISWCLNEQNECATEIFNQPKCVAN